MHIKPQVIKVTKPLGDFDSIKKKWVKVTSIASNFIFLGLLYTIG